MVKNSEITKCKVATSHKAEETVIDVTIAILPNPPMGVSSMIGVVQRRLELKRLTVAV